MRILVLTIEGRRPNIDAVFQALSKRCDLEVKRLPKEKNIDLRKHLDTTFSKLYDRILIDIPFKRSNKHYQYLNSFSNVFIYEEDSCQDMIKESKRYKAFMKQYKKMSQVKIINTGFQVSRHFQDQGINIIPLQKGFNSDRLFDEKVDRDIMFGFVGRVKSSSYIQRKNLLESLAQSRGLKMLTTQEGDEYRIMLNRISVFVSADVGLYEYMAKNIEAMACGCCVVAYEQGNGEEQWMGFKDMENIVLYKSLAEAEEKLDYLLTHTTHQKKIAQAGRELVNKNFTYQAMAQGFYEILQ